MSLALASNSLFPIAVISSGSMMPSYYRGDIVLMQQCNGTYEVGDVIVFNTATLKIPFIHRVVEVRQAASLETLYLTKGDNNDDNDREHYLGNKTRLEAKDIHGKVMARIPYLGQFSILMSEVPLLRVGFLALVALLYLVSAKGS